MAKKRRNINPYPYRHINNYSQRGLNAMKQCVRDIDAMIDVYLNRRGLLIINAEREMEEYLAGNRKHTPHLEKLEKFDREALALIELAKSMQAINFEVFGKVAEGEDENFERREAFNRIPMEDFRALDQIDEGDARVAKLNEMIDEQLEKKGNNCGHSLNDLIHSGYCSPWEHKPADYVGKLKPALLYDALDRFMYAILFPSKYKELFFVTAYVKDENGKNTKKKKKIDRWGKAWRQIRAEGRVGMAKVLMVLLPNMDIKSMRSGVYIKETKQFVGRRISDPEDTEGKKLSIATLSGMSRYRVKTALSNLVKVGILFKGKQKREKEWDDKKKEVKFKGLPVVRVFKVAFFKALGLYDKLMAIRDPEGILRQQYAEDARRRKAGLNSLEKDAELEKELQQIEANFVTPAPANKKKETFEDKISRMFGIA